MGLVKSLVGSFPPLFQFHKRFKLLIIFHLSHENCHGLLRDRLDILSLDMGNNQSSQGIDKSIEHNVCVNLMAESGNFFCEGFGLIESLVHLVFSSYVPVISALVSLDIFRYRVLHF